MVYGLTAPVPVRVKGAKGDATCAVNVFPKVFHIGLRGQWIISNAKDMNGVSQFMKMPLRKRLAIEFRLKKIFRNATKICPLLRHPARQILHDTEGFGFDITRQGNAQRCKNMEKEPGFVPVWGPHIGQIPRSAGH